MMKKCEKCIKKKTKKTEKQRKFKRGEKVRFYAIWGSGWTKSMVFILFEHFLDVKFVGQNVVD